MSASEKLQALETPARPFWDAGARDQESVVAANRCVDALVDALPQIVAVVEAAERVAAIPGDGIEALDRVMAPEWLRPSLAALEKALS